MKILLTNDDGYNAEGIQLLFDRLNNLGYDAYLVAPDRQRSGASHSITLFQDLIAEKVHNKIYRVSGTPADCVIFATNEIATDFDLVISGINAGQNMGEDIFYSGTVAAATEACFLGIPALAFSMCAYSDITYETGVEVVVQVLEMGIHKQLRKNELHNINIPNIPFEDIKGYKLTNIGERRYKNFMRFTEKNDSRWVYRVGGDAPEWVENASSDFYAVAHDYVSITPLMRKSMCFNDLKKMEEIYKL